MSTYNKPLDFSDFKVKGSREAEAYKKRQRELAMPRGVRWWLADDKDTPAAVMSHVAAIIQADKGRIDSYNTYAKLYGTWTPTFWNGYQLSNSGRQTSPMRDRLTYNIIQSCIDTLTSRIAQNKPKPMFLTQAGDSKLQRKAKKLDAFCYGTFYENGLYKLGPKSFRDGCVWGDGYIHPYHELGKIKYERVFPYEILIDYLESHYGQEAAKSLFRIKNIDRSELQQMFPEQKEKIDEIVNTSQLISTSNKSVGDTVTVIEAWRLPVGNLPGRHVMVTANAILNPDDQDYDDDFFPFANSQYSLGRLYGAYGQGMCEQLVPTQVEINRTLISIQRSLYLGGTHKIFVKAGSKVIKSHFDNMIGTIMEYAGDTAPQYVVPQLVQPEIYQHLEDMKRSGYELVGVSQLSASNQKPMGLDSGKAIRMYDDVQVQRFQTVAQQYEQLYVDLAKITVSVAKKAYKEHGDLSVKVPGKRFIEKISWKDVDMENDQFSLQIYPVSKLPQDPEGRLAQIQEMMQAGLIQPEVGRRLLDYPDLEAEENLANSSLDYLHSILDQMVEEGEFTPPEPFDDLQTARKLALEYYAQGKLNKLEEDKLDLLRKFMTQIDLLNQAAQAGAMQQMMATMPPQQAPQGVQGTPAPQPVNQLMPNVGQGNLTG